MKHEPHLGGSVFHRLLRGCLSETYHPTQADIEAVACKIWQDGFSSMEGRPWHDLVPGSDDHCRMIGAARMALGV